MLEVRGWILEGRPAMRAMLLFVVTVLAFGLWGGGSSADAQAGITVVNDEPVNEFPRGVTFEIEFRAAQGNHFDPRVMAGAPGVRTFSTARKSVRHDSGVTVQRT